MKIFPKMSQTRDKKFEMSNDELQRFEKSMKNPEFKKLFFDYMQDISDPKNRELYERELQQLEREKGFNVRYIKPEPCFVIKSDVYVNICSSLEVEKCSNKQSHWTIPFSLSKPRKHSKKEKEYDLYDCVFHPETIEKCSNERFRDLVISVAVEGIEKQFGTKVSAKFKIIKGKKSEGIPLMTMIREKDESLPILQETSLDFVEKIVKEQPKFEIPRFKIIHQQRYEDYQKFTGVRVLSNGRPDALVIKIDLPKIDSARDVDVDIQERTLDLQVPNMYRLHLDLPFPVLPEKGDAKFDKQKKTLTITVPVEETPVVESVAVAAEKLERKDEGDDLLQPSSNSMIELIDDFVTADEGTHSPPLHVLDHSDLIVDPTISEIIQDVTEKTCIFGSKNDSKKEFMSHTESSEGNENPAFGSVQKDTVSECSLDNKLDHLDLRDAAKDQTGLEERLQQLNVENDIDTKTYITPAFTAHQNDEIATLIIKVENVDSVSTNVTHGPKTFMLSFSDKENDYKVSFEFDNEFSKFHLNTSPKNVCVLLHKAKRESWTHLTLIEGESSSILSFLSLDNVPYDPVLQVNPANLA
jgi:hypothetical protein